MAVARAVHTALRRGPSACRGRTSFSAAVTPLSSAASSASSSSSSLSSCLPSAARHHRFHTVSRLAFPAPSRTVRAASRSTTAATEPPATTADTTPLPEAPTAPSTVFADNNGHDGSGSGSGNGASPIDWSTSFHGLSTVAFSPEVAKVLVAPLNPDDIEIKPDGILYLPEIKYRRILNTAFGPGGWGLAPRGELTVGAKVVSREYALVVHGRFVGQARGECPYFGEDTVATAGEGCKSNALMRCCKDLVIASELWDPRFIRRFRQSHCRQAWVEHVATKKRRQIWLRKDCDPVYPYAAVGRGE